MAACGFGLCACFTSGAFRHASEVNTPEAYRAFLAAHPRDREAPAARARLAHLEFERARRAHTIAGYKRFLDAFPDEADSDAARARLETMRFDAACALDTPVAYRQFLQVEPSGAHHLEAEKRLRAAELKALAKKGDLASLESKLKRSDDPRWPKVEAELDDRRFEKARANGAAALFTYLDDFPAGAHRTDAETILESLKIEGLLFDGQLKEARAEIAKSPLAKRIPELAEEVARAERLKRLLGRSDALVRHSMPEWTLRSLGDLRAAIRAPDPLDRWQAAEELGQYVDVRAIAPLLEAMRRDRNAQVREVAFEGLRTILTALPHELATYEVAKRLRRMRKRAGGPELFFPIGALEEISGALDRANTDYQRAFRASAPDPVILRRWVEMREERDRPFSAAVAARKIALWSKEVANDATLSDVGGIPLASSRDLCAAVRFGTYAVAAIAKASSAKTEFPRDVAEFSRDAAQVVKLAKAKLSDAQLLLRRQQPNARTCADHDVASRLADGAKARAEVLTSLPQKRPRLARLLLARAAAKDPVPALRAQAARELKTLGPALSRSPSGEGTRRVGTAGP